jgi:hypothetical protein
MGETLHNIFNFEYEKMLPSSEKFETIFMDAGSKKKILLNFYCCVRYLATSYKHSFFYCCMPVSMLRASTVPAQGETRHNIM